MDRGQIVAELEKNVDDLETHANLLGTIALARVGEEIAKAFRVRSEEVAILMVVGEGKYLQFLIPEKLRAIGTIPLTSTKALAARTAREKRPVRINKFNAVPHASVFEGVPLGCRHGEHIHRIMSAPLVTEGKVVGVVQISRKGRSPEQAGPEFSPDDLRELVALTSALGRLVSEGLQGKVP